MKPKFILSGILILFSFYPDKGIHQENIPRLTGPYLGQKPPGMTPELFAPGVFSTYKRAFNIVFSPCGNELYFVSHADNNGTADILCMKKKDNLWQKPEVVPFNSEHNDLNMCFSSDGYRFFWRSKRPLPGSLEPSKDRHYLWCVRRTQSGWTEPELVKYSGYKTITTAYQSITNRGDLYFATPGEVGDLDLHRSKFVRGSYLTPENLGPEINTEHSEADMFIMPDESFIIASCWRRPDNSGESDLYISFHREDGSWTKLINMGKPINNELSENCPMVTPDGKYFFFLRYDPKTNTSKTYWVDAKILKKLNPESSFKNLSGPYFGQKPPGMTPVEFFPELFSRTQPEWSYDATFSPCGNEFYFTVFDQKVKFSQIMCMKRVNNTWTKPEAVSFNWNCNNNNLCISPDGYRIFFRSWRPLPGHSEPEDRPYMWVIHRTEEDWSMPQAIKCGDGYYRASHPSVSYDGTIYFAHRGEINNYNSDIYTSKFKNSAYSTPVNLGSTINTKYLEGDLWIAPDESVLIVTCWDRPENNGESDLYISFRDKNGAWTALKNMGPPINTKNNENCAAVTPDGKYFFYLSVNAESDPPTCKTYWVDAKIIEDLKRGT
jgi:hypothetical protein